MVLESHRTSGIMENAGDVVESCQICYSAHLQPEGPSILTLIRRRSSVLHAPILPIYGPHHDEQITRQLKTSRSSKSNGRRLIARLLTVILGSAFLPSLSER